MGFDPELAALRFGTGLSPVHRPPRSARAWMRSVDGQIEAAYPMPLWSELQPVFLEFRRIKRAEKKAKKDGASATALKDLRAQAKEVNRQRIALKDQILRHTLARGVYDPTGFSTRLTLFWADHFSAGPKKVLEDNVPGDYMDQAIRPHILGRFEDMLIAVLQHPLMLNYLDQWQSVGPNSVIGTRKTTRGLNENLAREVLELHTLGVGGPYDQTDVRGLAKLFTGLFHNLDRGFFWRANMAEPGPLTVLGNSYDAPGLDRVRAVARDLARHPATAAHLAHKMARHFVGDAPDADLVRAMAHAFQDGDLGAMTETLLDHPAAWDPRPGNIKWGLDFMISAMRALNVPDYRLLNFNRRDITRLFRRPLAYMGHPFFDPASPAGFDELDGDVMTPQVLAARLDWALRAPERLVRGLPDPRKIMPVALGSRATAQLGFAVGAAEDRREGLALLFVSPAFQRR